jgi:predicted nucleotidyltransferase
MSRVELGLEFGIEQRHRELLSKLLVAPIKEAGGQLWVFGSRARGDHRKFSDLDILVAGPVPLGLISSVGEKLEESSLPFRVDLVFEPNLAESYRDRVLRERIELR